MARIQLTSGAYSSASLIASAQRCVNLVPEATPKETTPPTTSVHLLTPGLRTLATTGGSVWRCLYRATNGLLYGVLDSTVYYIDSSWVLHSLGTITAGSTPVYMSDNGVTAFIVDGSASGWEITLSGTGGTFAQITDSNFLGSIRTDIVDGFAVFHQPNTRNVYSTHLSSTVFDPLYFNQKLTYPDKVVGIISSRNEIWVIGELTTEVWYNAGGPQLPFVQVPGVMMEHGCASPYTIAKEDFQVFWLGQDLRGKAVVYEGVVYQAGVISTKALENEFQTYPTVYDAIGFTYQQRGHPFYVLTFPTANKTWVYDVSTRQWHQWAFTDGNGNLNRHRANCHAFAYDTNVAGDYANGQLYAIDPTVYQDFGNPISRIRSFPHLVADGKRVLYASFEADVEAGLDSGALDGTSSANPPTIFLRWSDDRGRTWGNYVGQSFGASGQYLTFPMWRALGIARDRVFELSWSMPAQTSLQGAFIDPRPLKS